MTLGQCKEWFSALARLRIVNCLYFPCDSKELRVGHSSEAFPRPNLSSCAPRHRLPYYRPLTQSRLSSWERSRKKSCIAGLPSIYWKFIKIGGRGFSRHKGEFLPPTQALPLLLAPFLLWNSTSLSASFLLTSSPTRAHVPGSLMVPQALLICFFATKTVCTQEKS